MTDDGLVAPAGLDNAARMEFYDALERREGYDYGTRGGWRKSPANPVLGAGIGTCFDMSVVEAGSGFQMWFSWRPERGIGFCESSDGVHWSTPELVLAPVPGSAWEADEVNRPSVVLEDGAYHMWYSGQMRPYEVGGISVIGYATSEDGRHWERREEPVLVHGQDWENHALMCPDVHWDDEAGVYRMWYSAGDNHEPRAIGYAESADGLVWSRPASNPVLTADPEHSWERHKVVASHVVRVDSWFYMFYVGHVHEERAAIGLARSRDGLSGWQRHPANPLIAPDRGAWDGLSVYKPFALRRDSGWLLWYNGAAFDPEQWVIEQIGLAVHEGVDLWA
jgi:predicted GH43/DUF377 family glycosyl hydrolase